MRFPDIVARKNSRTRRVHRNTAQCAFDSTASSVIRSTIPKNGNGQCCDDHGEQGDDRGSGARQSCAPVKGDDGDDAHQEALIDDIERQFLPPKRSRGATDRTTDKAAGTTERTRSGPAPRLWSGVRPVRRKRRVRSPTSPPRVSAMRYRPGSGAHDSLPMTKAANPPTMMRYPTSRNPPDDSRDDSHPMSPAKTGIRVGATAEACAVEVNLSPGATKKTKGAPHKAANNRPSSQGRPAVATLGGIRPEAGSRRRPQSGAPSHPISADRASR
jgi:hypothetical protein